MGANKKEEQRKLHKKHTIRLMGLHYFGVGL